MGARDAREFDIIVDDQIHAVALADGAQGRRFADAAHCIVSFVAVLENCCAALQRVFRARDQVCTRPIGDRVQSAPFKPPLFGRFLSIPHFCQNHAPQFAEWIQRVMPTAFRKFMCVVCGYIYDEAEGIPEEGIPPGTRFEDIPDTWTCPDCGATKADFEIIETE